MSSQIDHLLTENRRSAPSPDCAAAAVGAADLYDRADADRGGFWAEQARALHWHTPFTQVLDWSNPPFAKWFQDGELNVAANCLDRHVAAGIGDRVALYFEGEPGDTRTYTYGELTHEVKRAANMLTALGVEQGDRVVVGRRAVPAAGEQVLADAHEHLGEQALLRREVPVEGGPADADGGADAVDRHPVEAVPGEQGRRFGEDLLATRCRDGHTRHSRCLLPSA